MTNQQQAAKDFIYRIHHDSELQQQARKKGRKLSMKQLANFAATHGYEFSERDLMSQLALQLADSEMKIEQAERKAPKNIFRIMEIRMASMSRIFLSRLQSMLAA